MTPAAAEPTTRREALHCVGLIAALLIALGLTLTGIRSGLARDYFPAENVTADAARDLWLDRTWIPPTLIYPALPVYAQAAGQKLLAVARAGAITALPGRGWTRADWHLGARLSSPLLFALGILCTYLAGRRLGGCWAGLLAAAALVAAPLAVRFARMARPEPALLLFGAAGLLAAIGVGSNASPRRCVWAGLMAGLAGASKYNGAALLIAPLIALGAAPRSRRLGLLGWTAAGFLAGFAAGIPLAFIEPERLWSVWREQWDHYAYRGRPGRSGTFNLMFYVERLLERDLGIGATVLALLGVWIATERRDWRLRSLLGYSAVYLLLFSLMKLQAPHNLLLIFPALAVLAGLGVTGAAARLRRWLPAGAVIALGCAALLPGLKRNLQGASELTWPDTRDLMAHYLSTALPPGSRVALLGFSDAVTEFGPVRGAPYRVAATAAPAELIEHNFQFAVITSHQYERFLRRPAAAPRRTAYLRSLLAELEPNRLRRIEPEPWTRPGPTVLIYELYPALPPASGHGRALDLRRFSAKRGQVGPRGGFEGPADGRRGFFAISPSLRVEPGRYRVVSLIETAGALPPGKLGALELWQPETKQRLGGITLERDLLGPNGSGAVVFDAQIETPLLAKYRAVSRGRRKLALRTVWLERVSPPCTLDPLL